MTIDVSTRQYDDEIDLLRYGRFLSSYWMLLAGCALAGALAAFAISSLIPAQYQATATLTLTQPGSAAPFALTPASAKALVAGQTLVLDTIKEIGLDRDGMTTTDFIDEALDVRPVPSTTLVKLSVTLRDPTKARVAAARLATKMVDLSRTLNRDAASAAAAGLEKQMAASDASLQKVEEHLLEFELRANIEKLEADVQNLQRQQRETLNQRTELYRQRLELDRLHTDYLERVRVHSALAMRYEDARAHTGGGPQVEIVDLPIQPEAPVSRRRPQFAVFGAVIGMVAGVVAALFINRRRIDRPGRA
jgi:uncharacterized protein involved in exopolysaccharide biosynthesis